MVRPHSSKPILLGGNACFQLPLMLMSGKQSENRNGSCFMYLRNGRRDGAPERAFTFTELLAVLGTISSLALNVRALLRTRISADLHP